MRPRRPEVLAPAGDAASMRAAVRAGADAVYFGLQGFNARARATNFDAGALTDTMRTFMANASRSPPAPLPTGYRDVGSAPTCHCGLLAKAAAQVSEQNQYVVSP